MRGVGEGGGVGGLGAKAGIWRRRIPPRKRASLFFVGSGFTFGVAVIRRAWLNLNKFVIRKVSIPEGQTDTEGT